MPKSKPHAAYLKKAPSKVQAAFAKWIEQQTGHAVPEGDVALVQRLYPLYLQSDEVVKAREEAKAAKERAAEEKAAKVRQRDEAKLVALEQERHALLQRLGIEPEGEVPTLSVVPATVEPEADDENPAEVAEAEKDPDDEDAAEGGTLVLAEASDEFVEPKADDSEAEDLWDTDDGEDDF